MATQEKSEVKEKAKDKKLPERRKTFKIENQSYEVEFPNTGQLMEIEINKAQLSRNQYGALIEAGTFSSSYSRLLIDMIAVFNVLFPKLRKDMNVETISELNPIDSKKLLNVYLKQVRPWLDEWFEILNADDEE